MKDTHAVYLFRLIDEGKIISLSDLTKVFRVPDDCELQNRPVSDFIFGSKLPNLVIPCQIMNLPGINISNFENRFVLVDLISKPPNSRRKMYQIDWHNLEIKEKWKVNIFSHVKFDEFSKNEQKIKAFLRSENWKLQFSSLSSSFKNKV